jgi:hypothetical protein
MRTLRISALVVLGVMVAVSAAWFLLGDRGEGRQARAPFPLPESSRACAECHPEIYAQWEASFHRKAWDDPEVNLPGLNLRDNPDCWPCHVPEPLFLSGLGLLPRSRSVRRSEGVDCIGCHYTAAGMAGKAADPAAWCKPVVEKRIADMAVCEGCHNQHKTQDEWKTSKYHPETDCNDCHMPWVEGAATKGKPAKRYRAHSWPGSHDVEFIGSAVKVVARIEGEEAIVDVTNDRAGHNFPTDSRHHMAKIEGTLLTTGGDRVRDLFEEIFRNPYRSQFAMPNTQLRPGETRTYRVKIGPGEGLLRVRVLYCLQPSPTDTADALGGARAVVVKELRIPVKEAKDR